MKKVRLILGVIGIIIANMGYSQSSWNSWTKYSQNPVVNYYPPGGVNSASDPSVIWDGGEFKMIFSGDGILANSAHSSIIMATSPDGINWTILPNGNGGVVVASDSTEAWDQGMETAELIKVGNEYIIFYCGYNETIGLYNGETHLGRAVSTDGINFVKDPLPVMSPTPGGLDELAIWEIGIVVQNDTLFMIYEGWFDDNGTPSALIQKAYSIDDGQTWIKEGLLDRSNLLIGLLHPDIMKNADGNFSLFYSIDDGVCSGLATGIYHYSGPTPFGPFSPVGQNNGSIICLGTQAFEGAGLEGGFTSTVNFNGQAKMFYTGINDLGQPNQEIGIGLIESNIVTSTQELESNEPILILYPNPTSEKITIEYTLVNEDAVIFQLYSPSGQLLINEKYNGKFGLTKREIDLKLLPPACYFIYLIQGNSVSRTKMVKLQ